MQRVTGIPLKPTEIQSTCASIRSFLQNPTGFIGSFPFAKKFADGSHRLVGGRGPNESSTRAQVSVGYGGGYDLRAIVVLHHHGDWSLETVLIQAAEISPAAIIASKMIPKASRYQTRTMVCLTR